MHYRGHIQRRKCQPLLTRAKDKISRHREKLEGRATRGTLKSKELKEEQIHCEGKLSEEMHVMARKTIDLYNVLESTSSEEEQEESN